jgi:hypothetical protein
MAVMKCPKCGFEQEAASECRRCGIVFARYRPEGRTPREPADAFSVPAGDKPAPSLFRRLFRLFRWLVFAAAVTVLVLILRPSPPPRITVAPEAATESEAKVREFQAAMQAGRPEPLELDQSELNAWLNSNLAIRHPGSSDQPGSAEEPATKTVEPAPTPAEVQATMRDVKIELLEDSLRVYAAFDFHGKALSLELEGRLVTRDGYLRLEPTGGKLGSFPLPASVLESAMKKVFEAPENREKFHLPSRIGEMKVEKGSLVVVPR